MTVKTLQPTTTTKATKTNPASAGSTSVGFSVVQVIRVYNNYEQGFLGVDYDGLDGKPIQIKGTFGHFFDMPDNSGADFCGQSVTFNEDDASNLAADSKKGEFKCTTVTNAPTTTSYNPTAPVMTQFKTMWNCLTNICS